MLQLQHVTDRGVRMQEGAACERGTEESERGVTDTRFKERARNLSGGHRVRERAGGEETSNILKTVFLLNAK